MKTTVLTVQKYARQFGYLPDEQPQKKEKSYSGKRHFEYISANDSPHPHRDKWLLLRKEYPDANRTKLREIDWTNAEWLRRYDHNWFEENSPVPTTPVVGTIDWVSRDNEYLLKIRQAVEMQKNAQGKPSRICFNSIARISGLGDKLLGRLKRLPQTKKYVHSVIETTEEWHKRKIQWAIQQLLNEERELRTGNIIMTAGITKPSLQKYGYRQYIETLISDIENPIT